jgi:hypothetical protein
MTMDFAKELRPSARWLAILLSCFLTCENPAVAQTRAGLNVVIVEGEGAVNEIPRSFGRAPVVEVRDEDDKTVAGARVTFSAPERGPGGSFFGSGYTLTVTTNEKGRATGNGFRPNQTEGRFQIKVTAVREDRTGGVSITQSNVRSSNDNGGAQPKRKFWRSKTFALLALGAIVGAAVAAHGDDSSTTATPGTTITPGTISVGTPR